jgi:carbon starvation protein
MLRVCSLHLVGKPVRPLTEVPHSPSQLAAEWARD